MQVEIVKINESHIKVYSDPATERDIQGFFTFLAPGHQFDKRFRARLWDGKISLYNIRTKLLPIGLYPRLVEFCEEQKIEIIFNECDRFSAVNIPNDIHLEEIQAYVNDLNLWSKNGPINPRDYQVSAIHKAIRDKRVTLISPTASGKSLTIYGIIRWILEDDPDARVLLIVPSVSLVNQMFGDFKDYSTQNNWDVDKYCQKLYSGQSRELSKRVLITTWQSFSKISKDRVNGPKILSLYRGVVVDECFSGETKVLMSDDTWKQIKDINAGDIIKNVSSDGIIKSDIVVKQHQNLKTSESYDMYELETDTGEVIRVTGNHKVMTSLNVWKCVEDLQVGEEVLAIGELT